MNIPKKIIVHHSGDSSPIDQLSKINRYHEQRGFDRSELGFFVGYHYLINKLGIVTRTKYDHEIGCHDAGENINSLGVCLEGDFSLELPTEEQEKALGGLLCDLCRKYRLTALDIEPHRIRDDTECYGTLLSDDWASKIYLKFELDYLRKFLTWCQINLQHFLK